MKLFITIAAILFLASCKKETIKTPATNNNVSVANNGAFIFQYSGAFVMDETDFNPCTLEDVHITGTVPFQGQWVIENRILNSTFHYVFDSVRGRGLTTGHTYIGNGTYAAFSKSTFDSAQTFLIQNAVSHIIFTSPFGNESSTMRLNIKNESGNLTVDKEELTFDTCK
jgi:hypothetical protein